MRALLAAYVVAVLLGALLSILPRAVRLRIKPAAPRQTVAGILRCGEPFTTSPARFIPCDTPGCAICAPRACAWCGWPETSDKPAAARHTLSCGGPLERPAVRMMA